MATNYFEVNKKSSLDWEEGQHSFNDSLKRPPITPDTEGWLHGRKLMLILIGVFVLMFAVMWFVGSEYGQCAFDSAFCITK